MLLSTQKRKCRNCRFFRKRYNNLATRDNVRARKNKPIQQGRKENGAS